MRKLSKEYYDKYLGLKDSLSHPITIVKGFVVVLHVLHPIQMCLWTRQQTKDKAADKRHGSRQKTRQQTKDKAVSGKSITITRNYK